LGWVQRRELHAFEDTADTLCEINLLSYCKEFRFRRVGEVRAVFRWVEFFVWWVGGVPVFDFGVEVLWDVS
jgi:hypothetical protein